ncbi:MAG TPA: YesL family protein, partial [Phototrophicaceae bacterium]|nr:YesL family protein [Phototrophicaceae bacterium]
MKSQPATHRKEVDDFREHLDKWSMFILANLLWALLSIPLITFPAATAGLFATMSRWVRGKPPELFQEFFGGMRRYWLT